MEHRYNRRIPITVDFVMQTLDGTTLHAHTIDFSFGGMRIAVGPEVVLHCNTMVEMGWLENGRCKTIHALVVNAEAGEVGLMFVDLGHDLLAFIKELLALCPDAGRDTDHEICFA